VCLAALLSAVVLSCRESSRKALLGDPCAKIVVRFEDELAAAGEVCETDLDCTCFVSISTEVSPCSGVAPVRTQARLQALVDEYHHAGCVYSVECAKRTCEAHCVRGHCQ
jgi:hypothetical protein